MTVERGVPDIGEVVSLLNDAYDIWGTEELFEWRYDECPDYDAEEHTFHIYKSDDLAAFARVTYKELFSENNPYPAFVLGDAGVIPEHQGQGLYSQLHQERIQYCEGNAASMIFTFTRKGNIPFEVNQNRGWQYRELPLHIRILSPTEVIPNYAQLVTEDSKWLRRLIGLLGSRVTLKLSDGELALGELIDGSPSVKRLNLSFYISDYGVQRLVEVASNDPSLGALVKSGLTLLLEGEISPFDRDHQTSFEESETKFEIVRSKELEFSDDEFEEIMGLYDTFFSQYDLSFRREREDLEHLLSHPGLVENIRIWGQGALVGFAPVAFHPGSDSNELRVLDLVYATDDVKDALLSQIVQCGVEYHADLISLFSSGVQSKEWAAIQKQVIMWEQLTKTDLETELNGSDWHFGFYDIA